MSDRLKRSLNWFLEALDTDAFEREVSESSTDEHAIIYTDASLGRLGWVLLLPNGDSECFTWVSPNRSKGYPIEFYETEWVLLALRFWKEKISESNLLLLIDNTSSQGSIVKGYSSNKYFCDLIDKIWLTAAELKLGCWIERVKSEHNIWDGPSRNDFSETKRHNIDRVELSQSQIKSFLDLS